MPEETVVQEKYCLKHPQKKIKYFCENDQMLVCSKCIVSDHKGHRITDKDGKILFYIRLSGQWDPSYISEKDTNIDEKIRRIN